MPTLTHEAPARPGITRLCDFEDCRTCYTPDDRLPEPDDYRRCPAHRELKGLPCGILQNKRIGNCSNGGISSKYDSVILVGEGIPRIFAASETSPAVVLENYLGYRYAVPVDAPAGMVGPMAGGCYIHTSDDRFPAQYPIPLHDRFETQSMADSMHD